MTNPRPLMAWQVDRTNCAWGGVEAWSLPSEKTQARNLATRALQGFGFRISDFGSLVSGLWFRVSGFGVRFRVFGFRVSGFGFRVSGFGFRVSGFGFRVSGLEFQVYRGRRREEPLIRDRHALCDKLDADAARRVGRRRARGGVGAVGGVRLWFRVQGLGHRV